MHGVLRQWDSFTEQWGSRSTGVWSGTERPHNTNRLLLSGTEKMENTDGTFMLFHKLKLDNIFLSLNVCIKQRVCIISVILKPDVY